MAAIAVVLLMSVPTTESLLVTSLLALSPLVVLPSCKGDLVAEKNPQPSASVASPKELVAKPPAPPDETPTPAPKENDASKDAKPIIAENAGVLGLLVASGANGDPGLGYAEWGALGKSAVQPAAVEASPPIGKWDDKLASRNSERSMHELLSMKTSTREGQLSQGKAKMRIEMPNAYLQSDMGSGHWQVAEPGGDFCTTDKTLCQAHYSMGTSLRPSFSIRLTYRPSLDGFDCNQDKSDCAKLTVKEKQSIGQFEVELERYVATNTQKSVRCGGGAYSFSAVGPDELEATKKLLVRVCNSMVVELD